VTNFYASNDKLIYFLIPEENYFPFRSPREGGAHMKIPSQVKSFCIMQFANTNLAAGVKPQYHRRDRKTDLRATQFTLCVSSFKRKMGNCPGRPTSLTRRCKGSLTAQPMKVNCQRQQLAEFVSHDCGIFSGSVCTWSLRSCNKFSIRIFSVTQLHVY